MKEYLSPEQRAELERQLQQGDMTQEQAQTALEEGARMAQADAAREQERALLNEAGFEDVSALLEAWQRTRTAVQELRGMLEQLGWPENDED